MDEFLNILQQHIRVVENIGDKIENQESYLEDIKEYLPFLNEMVMTLLDLIQNPAIALEISQEFVLQVLTDIVYGIEQEDTVFLLDVLRYGLLEVYYYIEAELQGEEIYEETGI